MTGNSPLSVAVVAGLTVGIAFVVIISLGFQTKRALPEDIVMKSAVVKIPANSTAEDGCQCFDPKNMKVIIGLNNTVRWVNEDDLPYTVASDNDYKDPVTGIPFTTESRSLQDGGPFIMPRGGYYEFTFNEPGVFPYHSIPHPQLKGSVVVSKAQ